MGKVRVRVYSADLNGNSIASFIEVKVGTTKEKNESKGVTQVLKGTSNPMWNFSWEQELQAGMKTLKVTLREKGPFWASVIGYVRIKLEEFASEASGPNWFVLNNETKKKKFDKCRVQLEIFAELSDDGIVSPREGKEKSKGTIAKMLGLNKGEKEDKEKRGSVLSPRRSRSSTMDESLKVDSDKVSDARKDALSPARERTSTNPSPVAIAAVMEEEKAKEKDKEAKEKEAKEPKEKESKDKEGRDKDKDKDKDKDRPSTSRRHTSSRDKDKDRGDDKKDFSVRKFVSKMQSTYDVELSLFEELDKFLKQGTLSVSQFVEKSGITWLMSSLAFYLYKMKSPKKESQDLEKVEKMVSICRTIMEQEFGQEKLSENQEALATLTSCIEFVGLPAQLHVMVILVSLFNYLDSQPSGLFSKEKEDKADEAASVVLTSLTPTLFTAVLDEVTQGSDMKYKSTFLALINGLLNVVTDAEDRDVVRETLSMKGMNEDYLNKIKTSFPEKDIQDLIDIYRKEADTDTESLNKPDEKANNAFKSAYEKSKELKKNETLISLFNWLDVEARTTRKDRITLLDKLIAGEVIPGTEGGAPPPPTADGGAPPPPAEKKPPAVVKVEEPPEEPKAPPREPLDPFIEKLVTEMLSSKNAKAPVFNIPMPTDGGPPPPPPMGGMGGPPPPPPPPGGMGGPPPPPPPPPMGGPPPPPPPPMGGPPPPPPPMGGPPLPPPPPPPGGGPPPPPFGGPKAAAPKPAGPKLMPLRLKKLPAHMLKKTVFAEIGKQQLPELDTKALVNLFEQKPKTAATTVKKPGADQINLNAPKVIMQKRNDNLDIFIKKHQIDVAALKEFIMAPSGEADLDLFETLKNMFSSSPEEEAELKAYDGSRGPLSKAEQFLLTLYEIPRLGSKLSSIFFKLEFEHVYSEYKERIKSIKDALSQLLTDDFQQLLAYVIVICRVLNKNTTWADTQGFVLSDLLKLAELRSPASSDTKITLLDFLVDELEAKRPDLLEEVVSSSSFLDAATKSILVFEALFPCTINSLIDLCKEINMCNTPLEKTFKGIMIEFRDQTQKDLLKAKQELDKIDEDIVYLGDNDFASSELLKVKDEISNMWSIVDREEYMAIKNERVDRDFFRFAFFNNMKNFISSLKTSRNASAARAKKREKEEKEKVAAEHAAKVAKQAPPAPAPEAPVPHGHHSSEKPMPSGPEAPSAAMAVSKVTSPANKVATVTVVTSEDEDVEVLKIEGDEEAHKDMVDIVLKKYSEKVSNKKSRQYRQSMRASIGRFVASSMKKADLDAMMEKKAATEETSDNNKEKESSKDANSSTASGASGGKERKKRDEKSKVMKKTTSKLYQRRDQKVTTTSSSKSTSSSKTVTINTSLAASGSSSTSPPPTLSLSSSSSGVVASSSSTLMSPSTKRREKDDKKEKKEKDKAKGSPRK